jgi:hypothetical protein
VFTGQNHHSCPISTKTSYFSSPLIVSQTGLRKARCCPLCPDTGLGWVLDILIRLSFCCFLLHVKKNKVWSFHIEARSLLETFHEHDLFCKHNVECIIFYYNYMLLLMYVSRQFRFLSNYLVEPSYLHILGECTIRCYSVKTNGLYT